MTKPRKSTQRVLEGLLLLCLTTGAGADEEETAIDPEPGLPTLPETVVTASRADQTLETVAGHVSIVSRRQLRQVPAQTLDDVLRQTPAFSLFRRSSSQVAHPTTQGVSLRGIGASGASRTLVLLDGMPLNDPFGGWVQWGRVNRHQLERVEMLRGGGAHLWGNQALGGVIYLVTTPLSEPHLSFQTASGNRTTGELALSSARGLRDWDVGVDGHVATAAGYPILSEDQRGDIDEAADSENAALRLKLGRQLSANVEFMAQAGLFGERRGNGTPLTENSTETGYAAGRGVWTRPQGDRWTFSGFAQKQQFESVFSSQAADRDSERPALDQFDVPSTALGASVEWLGDVSSHHALAAGTDWRWSSGKTNEDYRNLTGAFSRRRRAGGDQLVVGTYLQDAVALNPRWRVAVGSRLDLWRSTAAGRRETDLESGETLQDEAFEDRSEWMIGPRAGLRFTAAERLFLRATVHRSFRAPTLNELYRPFRVRNDITEANEGLELEKLIGVELGLDWYGDLGRSQLSAFWNRIDDGVVNMTLAPGLGAVVEPCGFVPEGGSCRQRRNVDRIRAQGLEIDATASRGSWSIHAGYAFTDSEIRRSLAQPTLEGRRVPQVPRQRLTAQLAYDRRRLRAAIYLRHTGAQFEDDANAIKLDAFTLVDLSLERPVGAERTLFATVENVFDAGYAVGETTSGLVSEGAPRLLRAGLRGRF